MGRTGRRPPRPDRRRRGRDRGVSSEDGPCAANAGPIGIEKVFAMVKDGGERVAFWMWGYV